MMEAYIFVVFIIFPFSCVYFSCRANAGSDNEVISNRLAPAITTISITLCVYPIRTHMHTYTNAQVFPQRAKCSRYKLVYKLNKS